MPELTLLSIAVLLSTLALSLALNWYFIRNGSRDIEPDMERRIHVTPVGKHGGIAIYLSILAVVGGGALAVWVLPGFLPREMREKIESHLEEKAREAEQQKNGKEAQKEADAGAGIKKPQKPIKKEVRKQTEKVDLPETIYTSIALSVYGARNVIPSIVVLFGAATLIFLVGVLDDRRGVRWRYKLFVQIGAALALALFGFKTSAFSAVPGLNYIVSVLWIVGITNAFNFIDGMDGLCAGVAAIACGILAYFMSAYDHPLVLLFLMALTGALLGFLRFNFSPAKIFMGDGGSTFVGFMLAAITLQASYSTIETKTILPVLMPVLILAIPLYDTSSVVIIRLAGRKSPFMPDTNHLHHRLRRFGMSDRQAVFFIWTMAFAMGINATLLSQVDALGGGVILTQALAIMGLFAIIERVMRKEVKALCAGRTDPLFSVKARFTPVEIGGKPRSLAECVESSGIAREFGEDGYWLIPETPLACEELAGYFVHRKAFKVELALNGSEGVSEITTICILENVEQKPGGPQRLRLAIEKMSGKSRIRYNKFLEENVEKREGM